MNLNECNKKIENAELRLQRLKREDYISKARAKSAPNKEKRKKRRHDLIMRGALFETVGLIGEAPESLLGFLMENIELYHTNKDKYYEIGFKELESRKSKDVKDYKIVTMITKEQITELLELSTSLKSKNIDVGTLMQQKFKKKLFDQLTQEEFLFFKELNEIK